MKNILIIEKNLFLRENLTELFELKGYNVQVTDNGRQGVEFARESIPSLIVSEIFFKR